MQTLSPAIFRKKCRRSAFVGRNYFFAYAGKMMFAAAFMAAMAMPVSALTRNEKKGLELQHRGEYYEAIKMYAKTFSKKDTSVIGLEGTAQCYLALRNYPQAEIWFVKRMSRPSQQGSIPLYAQTLVYNGKYEQAKILMENAGYFDGRDALITVCDSAQHWLADKTPEYIVRNVYTINSPYDDYAALPLGNNPFLFCSIRPDIDPKRAKAASKQAAASKSGSKSKSAAATAQSVYNGEPPAEFVRIWEAEAIYNKSKGMDTIYKPKKDFRPAALAMSVLNAKKTHNGPLAYTKPSTLYFSRSSAKKSKGKGETVYNLEIYSLPYDLNSKNNKIAPFANNKPKDYSVTHPCLSPNGKILYFVSDMPNGAGGKDIWFCEIDKNGGWGAPQNCGSVINTPADEVFPTMDSEGTLYFSSNGHPGMGGLDIFMAKGSRDKWQRPENMRSPINSSGDDFYLIKTDDNMRGYFSSNRTIPDFDGRQPMGGDDIYTFAPSEEVKEPYLWDIRVPSGYGEAYVPQISMASIGKQPLFPPSVLVQDAAPVRVAEHSPKQPDTAKTSPLICEAVDSKTASPIEGVKICATQKDSRNSKHTYNTKCNYTNSNGRVEFDLIAGKEYIITAFKTNYKETGPPLQLRTEQVIPNQALSVTMRRETAEIDDIDKYIKKKKFKSAARRGQPEYRIHVLAIGRKSKRDRGYFDKIKEKYPSMYPPQLTTDSRYKRYTCGSFARLADAQAYLKRFAALGYGKENEREKCFIAVFVNGKLTNKKVGGSTARKSSRKR